eukprot:TRINITY_DN91008_c0_g1_i1.p1 TRINITY_DN91008_c0_g1~~TRINITY_DN91008_c0_g1_i1.p1  ORF type:complete len:316 (+),score=35.77 TRINITY_DN91008_c0_g1_i1:47-994(+)
MDGAASLPLAVSSESSGGRARRCLRPSESWWVPGATLLGVIVGLLEAALANNGSATMADQVSAVLGWTYFCMWSVSFYPQVVQNHLRRSVRGLSVEFQLLNFVGFSCYFVFNAGLYWIPAIQDEYRARHDGHSSAVQLNDVVFAGHAACVTLITLVQIALYYDHPGLSGLDKVLRHSVYIAVTGFFIVACGLVGLIFWTSQNALNWLDFLYILSSVKVAITIFKYCPQVWMNYSRGSTDGWSIHNVLLDFSGGFLSTLQLIFDAWRDDDWSKVTGDPAKLLLGNVSIIFDIIFMIQHYCLYRDARRGGRTPTTRC